MRYNRQRNKSQEYNSNNNNKEQEEEEEQCAGKVGYLAWAFSAAKEQK